MTGHTASPLLPQPSFLFLEITSECNLRCKQCHLWRTRERPGSLETAEKVRVLGEFIELASRPVVVLTGGETMSKREELYALASAARARGASSAANTNGTLATPDDVPRLLEEGPRYLVLSIDSHREDLHDYVRGVAGTFARVVGLLRSLADERTRRHTDVRLLVNAIVFDANVDELGALVDFAVDAGADGVMFQMLSRTFALGAERDAFFERHFPRDLEALDAAIDELLERKRAGQPVLTSENDLTWMKLYARNPDFIGEQVCGSHERNLMVDSMGDVQLCFDMKRLTGGRPLGNVRHESLASMWAGDRADEARAVMSRCRRNCGMLHCHRRQS